MAKKPLLTLATSQEDKFIEIDDKAYAIKNIGQLSLVELYSYRNVGGKFKALENPDVTAEEVNQVQSTIDSMAKAIFINIPDAVFNKLDTFQKLEIMKVFQTVPLPLKIQEEIEKAESSLQ
jgi:hypothetical protein